MRMHVPAGMATPRFRAEKTVDVPQGEKPLVHPNDPVERQVRKRLICHVRVFNLLDEKDLKDYEAVWQRVSDKAAVIVNPVAQPIYIESKGIYAAFLRWGDYAYVAPGAQVRTPEVESGIPVTIAHDAVKPVLPLLPALPVAQAPAVQ